MARKPSKATLKRKLDKLFSEIVRSKGECERCGRRDVRLECAHVNSRRFLVTRWDFDNALSLCSACHRWGHNYPVEFADFVIGIKGKDTYESMMFRAKNDVTKVDFAQKYEELKLIKKE